MKNNKHELDLNLVKQDGYIIDSEEEILVVENITEEKLKSFSEFAFNISHHEKR